jgi:hypothetical protein
MHRGWMDNPVLGREKYTRAMAWCYLIEHAAFADTTQTVGENLVRVTRGQYATAVRFLADAWGWSKTAVERFLNRLKTGTMIGTQTGTRYTVITICNYDKYQSSEDQTGTQTGHKPGQDRDTPGTKNKKVEEGKERKKDISIENGFDEWWEIVPRKVGKGHAETAFRAALKIATLETLITGMTAYATSCRGKDRQYILHPATWLNGKRWLDDDAPQSRDKTRKTIPGEFW